MTIFFVFLFSFAMWSILGYINVHLVFILEKGRKAKNKAELNRYNEDIFYVIAPIVFIFVLGVFISKRIKKTLDSIFMHVDEDSKK